MNHHDFGIARAHGKVNKMTYYAIHGQVARDCYRCDLRRCKCDETTMRRVKRGARQQWRREIEMELSQR